MAPNDNDDDNQTLSERLGIKTDLGKAALRVALQNIQILDKKQQDYGPHNIGLWGEHGIAVRATDKVMRLRQFILYGQDPQNESKEDSYCDLANYGVIGQLIIKGIWPLIK